MKEEQSKIEETVDSIKDYINTQYELTVLKALDKVAHITSNSLSFLPIGFLTGLTVIMLSFGLALYLNTVLESTFLGFLFVGGGYFVVTLLIAAIRKNSVAKPLRNKIIKELFKNHNM